VETFLNGRIVTFEGCYFWAVVGSGLPPTGTKKLPDPDCKAFYYNGHESAN